MFNHEVLPSTRKPTLDFIDNEEDTVLIADVPEALEELRRRRYVPAFTEERLDDDGSGVARRGLLCEEEI